MTDQEAVIPGRVDIVYGPGMVGVVVRKAEETSLGAVFTSSTEIQELIKMLNHASSLAFKPAEKV